MRKLLILLLITTSLLLFVNACEINQECQGDYLNQDEYIITNTGGLADCRVNGSIKCCGSGGWSAAIMNYYDNMILPAEFSVEFEFERNPWQMRVGLANTSTIDATDIVTNSEYYVAMSYSGSGSVWHTSCFGVGGNDINIGSTDLIVKFVHEYGETHIHEYISNGNDTWYEASFAGNPCQIPNLTRFISEPLVGFLAATGVATTDCVTLWRIGITSKQEYTTQFRVKNFGIGQDNCTLTMGQYAGMGFTPAWSNTSGSGYSSKFTIKPACYWDEDDGWTWRGYIDGICPGIGTFTENVNVTDEENGHLYTVLLDVDETTTTTTTSTTTTTTAPFNFRIEIGVTPEQLPPGGLFNVFVHQVGGGYLPNNACYVLAGPFTGQIFPLNTSETSFAWNIEGNTVPAEHQMDYQSFAPYWKFKTQLPLKVNTTTPTGDYVVYANCTDENYNHGEEYGLIHVRSGSTNSTSNSSLAYNFGSRDIIQGTTGYFWVEMLDGRGYLISGASCILNVSNETVDNFISNSMTETTGRHTTSIIFNQIGNLFISAECVKSGYDNARIEDWAVTVLIDSCNNNIKDNGEIGVDCGGPCWPCSPTTTLPGGDVDCAEEDELCGSNSDCCDGLYCRGPPLRHPAACKEPTCEDDVKNQGEAQVDCGGNSPCPDCAACIYDNDCGNDGSWMCNITSGYQCDRLTCTSDIDCPILTNWYTPEVGLEQKQTYCDTNRGICTLENRNTVNQTILFYGMDISPITGFMANKSGTLFYTLNCDDDNNGFIIRTNVSTTTYYSFASSPYTPALPYDPGLRSFDEGKTGTNKKALIRELCEPVDGYGGMPVNSSSMFARINIISSGGSVSFSKLVDVIVYRHNIKNSLSIGEIQHTTETEYNMTVTNRSIYVQVRKSPSDQYTNVTDDYLLNVFFNASQISNTLKNLPIFYYRLNTPYGEKYEYKYGKPWWMPITYTEEDGWGLNFTIREWMIWIILALIIMGAVYANYRLQRRQY